MWEKVYCEGNGPKAREMNTAHIYIGDLNLGDEILEVKKEEK